MQNARKLKAWFWIWRVFGTNSHLNETACFGKNGVVSSTVHQKKSPKRCRFNGTVGLLLPLDERGRGRRRFFFPLFSPTFFLSKASKRRRPRTPTCPKAFHVLDGRWRGGSTVVAPAMSLPCFSINTGEMKKQDPGKKRGDQEKRENRTREEQRGEGREKRREKRRRKEKKEAEEGDEEEGEAPPPLPPSAPQ